MTAFHMALRYWLSLLTEADSFVIYELFLQLGLKWIPLLHNIPARVLDGHILGTIMFQTSPVFWQSLHDDPQYYNLQKVFSKAKATSLTPHCPYKCAINLLLDTSTLPPVVSVRVQQKGSGDVPT